MQYLDPQISDKNAILRPILTGHFCGRKWL